MISYGPKSRRFEGCPLWPVFCIALALPLLAGGLVFAVVQQFAWVLPDSAGWLDGCRPHGCWAGPRTPPYGWIAGLLPESLLVWAQLLALGLGACALIAGLFCWGASVHAGLAVALTVGLSTITLLWGRALLPEAFAHALLLACFGAVLWAARGGRPGAIVLAGALAAGAYLMKPGFLTVVPVLPVLLLALGQGRLRTRFAAAVALLAVSLTPFVLISSVRLARLGDFNVISYGGFQMSGMAALMLDPAVVARLAPAQRPAAQDILTRRTALEAAGTALRLPENSLGARSFDSTALGYFDLLARTHDYVLFAAVAPTQGADESWVAFNARMQRLAFAVLRAAPDRYAAWVVGASARLVGRMLVANPALVLGVLAWLAVCWRPFAPPGQDLRALSWVVGGWLLGVGLPAVVLTFPAGRYADSAGMLLAALPFWVMSRHLIRTRETRTAPQS